MSEFGLGEPLLDCMFKLFFMPIVHLRGDVWMRVSGGFDEQQRFPELYQSLLKKNHDVNIGELQLWNAAFNIDHEFKNTFSSAVESIRIDLPRTFPENPLFGIYRRSLFNVLIAFASYDQDIGYCQGLNYIAGNIEIILADGIILA